MIEPRTVAHGNKRRLVVVLGMHRSGTSAVARSLMTLGVDLGESLEPAVAGVNEKGFFEDSELNAFNEQLLQNLGRSWHSMSALTGSELASAGLASARAEAASLLSRKMAHGRVFGVKNPRFARLLPFWQPVFGEMNLDVSYVIVVRNPISVARSLARRDGFAPIKSYYLWLQHLVPAIVETHGATRVVVDYDLLLDDPVQQVERIAVSLKLRFDMRSEGLRDFANNFLERRLRHTRFGQREMLESDDAPEGLADAYLMLQDAARARTINDTKRLTKGFGQFGARLATLEPLLAYVDETEGARDSNALGPNNCRSQLAQLTARLAATDKALGEAQHLSLARMEELSQLTARLAATDKALGEAQHLSLSQERELESVRLTRTWRLRSALWRLLGRDP